jgi:A/G-specific adenine glycosylase
MLQQTRVAAVLDHYGKFVKRFPNVRSLAAAPESDVLAIWSGLGYYRRARMMHRAARELVEKGNAEVPRSAAELLSLPGIGRYTANAIASIAFGEPVAVVDGNVERVITRMTGRRLSEKQLWQRAQNLLDPKHPGDFNQAMMELGATICVPRTPLCGQCPIRRECNWNGRENRRLRTSRNQRSASLLLALRQGRQRTVLLYQRSSHEGIMPGMWELPKFEPTVQDQPILAVSHSITNTDWTVSVFELNHASSDAGTRWIPLRSLGQVPLTGVTRKILRRLELLA